MYAQRTLRLYPKMPTIEHSRVCALLHRVRITIAFEGKDFPIDVDEIDSVETLKYQIYSLVELEPDKQVLQVRGTPSNTPLASDATLSSAGVREGSCILVTRRRTASQPGSADAKSSFDAATAQLVSMGFDAARAATALRSANGNVSRAAAVLLGGRNPGPATVHVHEMAARIKGIAGQGLSYENPQLQAKALAAVPAARLRRNALQMTTNGSFRVPMSDAVADGGIVIKGPYPPSAPKSPQTGYFFDWEVRPVVGIKVWVQADRVAGFILTRAAESATGSAAPAGSTHARHESFFVRGRLEGDMKQYMAPEGDTITSGCFFFSSSGPKQDEKEEAKMGALCGMQMNTSSGGHSPLFGTRGRASAFLCPPGMHLAGLGGVYTAPQASGSVTWGFSQLRVSCVRSDRETAALQWMDRKLGAAASSPAYRDNLVKHLLQWFKGGFFRWAVIRCAACGAGTRAAGAAPPTQSERAFRCGVVELHVCNGCGKRTRFPRYNDPGKLFETRMGRCGEFANAFTLLCRAFGVPARHVTDWTDHVWTEVHSDVLGRWVHCDPCEKAWDAPLVYEAGWGKKLSFIVAGWAGGVTDVTRRYTRKNAEVSMRRLAVCPEATFRNIIAAADAAVKARLSPAARARSQAWDRVESAELARLGDTRSSTGAAGSTRALSATETKGRQTGSLEWRRARGELGGASSPGSGSAGMCSRVTRVSVRSGLWVDQITFENKTRNERVSFGRAGGTEMPPFDLQSGYLSAVQARVGDHTDAVRFVCSDGRMSRWYGDSQGGTHREYKAPQNHHITGLRLGPAQMCPPIIGVFTTSLLPREITGAGGVRPVTQSDTRAPVSERSKAVARKALAGYVRMLMRGCGDSKCTNDICRSAAPVLRQEALSHAKAVRRALVLLKQYQTRRLCPAVRRFCGLESNG